MQSQYTPIACSHCGRTNQRKYIGGLCKSCYEYKRTRGEDRPLIIPPSRRYCMHCGRLGVEAMDRCGACYQYVRKHGRDRSLEPTPHQLARAQGLRHCSTCKRNLPVDMFMRSARDGWQSQCNECHRSRMLEYYKAQRASRPQIVATCDVCGVHFVVSVYTSVDRARFCSKACKSKQWPIENRERRKAHKSKSDAISRGATIAELIDYREIYERDNWTCQICGEPVDPSLTVRHAMSATLDHIIPLSRGGAHLKENLQVAHLRCNASKKDRIL